MRGKTILTLRVEMKPDRGQKAQWKSFGRNLAVNKVRQDYSDRDVGAIDRVSVADARQSLCRTNIGKT